MSFGNVRKDEKGQYGVLRMENTQIQIQIEIEIPRVRSIRDGTPFI